MPDGIHFAVAINTTPASLLDPHFEARAVAQMVRQAGIDPRQVTLECTEQQAVRDIVPLQRQVKALRKLGFGFAIDDAGAGYASFTLIAALRPTIIKIDREIVHGCAANDAKKALVEAFVSFGRRIDARLIAEGIETHRELDTLRALGVEYGQGYLLGRPSESPSRRARSSQAARARRAHLSIPPILSEAAHRRCARSRSRSAGQADRAGRLVDPDRQRRQGLIGRSVEDPPTVGRVEDRAVARAQQVARQAVEVHVQPACVQIASKATIVPLGRATRTAGSPVVGSVNTRRAGGPDGGDRRDHAGRPARQRTARRRARALRGGPPTVRARSRRPGRGR